MRNRIVPILFFLGIFLLQAALFQTVFPVQKIWSGDNIYNEDYGKLFYYTELGRTFLQQSLRLNGYSPDFYAGFLTHPTYHSCTFLQIYGFLLPWVPTNVLVKCFVFLLPVCLPLLFALSGSLFGFRWAESLITALLGTAFFYLHPTYYLFWCGSIHYYWSLFLTPLTAGFLYRWLEEGDFRYIAGLFVLLPLNTLLHAYSIISLFPFAVCLFILYGRSIHLKEGILLTGLGFLTLLVNSTWLLGFFHSAPVGIREVIELMKPEMYIFRIPPEITFKVLLNPVQVLLFFLAGFGCLRMIRKNPRRGRLWTAVSMLSLFMCLFFLLVPGFFFLAPVRFFGLLFAILVFPAGTGLYDLFWHGPAVLGRNPSLRFGSYGLLVLFLVYSGFWPSVTRYPLFMFGPFQPFIMEMPEHFQEQADWLIKNTDSGARILYEDQKIPSYFGTRPALHLQMATGREFIGGPRNDNNIRALRIDFHAGHLGFRRMNTVSTDELEEFLERYNIGWVACWSQEARAIFRSRPDRFRHETTLGKTDFFTILRDPTFFLVGDGVLQAGYNSIDLRDVCPENGRIRLSYHYIPGMKIRGKGELVPFTVSGDPTPLIEIRNPGRELIIQYDP